jgi:hypothetical protein
MTDGVRLLTIPRHNPVNAYTMGGIVQDAGGDLLAAHLNDAQDPAAAIGVVWQVLERMMSGE